MIETLGRPPFDPDEKMFRVTIGLDQPTLVRLKREAVKRNVSFSQIIRELIVKAENE